LNTTLMPHSIIIPGDACLAYFNKIWGILQRNERVKLSCHARSVSAQLNLVGANLRPDAAAAPHGRTSGVDRGNPPTRRTPGIDKNARLRFWADRPRDGQRTSRAETQ
jgi:hypothetical protein